MPVDQSGESLLAQVQHGFVDLRVCPVVPDVIQVIIKIHQCLVGFAVQEGRSDPLGFGPIFTEVTRVEKNPEYIGITEKNSGKLSHAGTVRIARPG